MNASGSLEVIDGLGRFVPRGASTLPAAVDLVSAVIAQCRRDGVGKLLVDPRSLTGVQVPTLVDRFLAIEDWASSAEGAVRVAFVLDPPYIHSEKFGVKLGRDLGLDIDAFTSEREALRWLAEDGSKRG